MANHSEPTITTSGAAPTAFEHGLSAGTPAEMFSLDFYPAEAELLSVQQFVPCAHKCVSEYHARLVRRTEIALGIFLASSPASHKRGEQK